MLNASTAFSTHLHPKTHINFDLSVLLKLFAFQTYNNKEKKIASC